MIASFRHKGLKRFWEDNDERAVHAKWRKKALIILSRLDVSAKPEEMNLPGLGFRFHPLKGDRAGRYAVTVSPNWRITFGWSGEDAVHVDLEDYHGD
ncbi:type II toxin-antitoxin system RelE/ParE family toxin [Methylocystis sp. H4A]|uniref:type II toxin-antitoxin system RelE/ParE family toxin n=1 Tax=Methylocystis sp. H4A TaxID=2785788 RepID=UPI0018C2E7CD|nr:type II toxin-antitoxin system RelE/ParE family toxin [Methylocystis sp. H4A]MBG0800790.1 type II toxin-antitoxin system RelE/ParE family toxin [Methylocystis sp. H4A]